MSLKACLFKISRLKGVGIIGRWAYILCSGFVSLVFRLTPEIRSAYLAGSMSGGDIAPGLSDIDFVIVIKDLSAPDEYRFVNSLEKTLRYLLPPFGKDKLGTHVLIYSVGEWTLVGDLFSGKRYGQPRKLFQKDEITWKHNYGRALKGLHQFYKALWRLEAIQRNLPVPVDNGLERALGERILERSLLSIENGFSEVRGAGETPPSYISLRNEITHFKSLWTNEQDRKKLFKALEEKDSIPPTYSPEGRQNFFPHICLTYRRAKWSLDTVVSFIDYYYSELGIKSPLYERDRKTLTV